MSCRNQYLMAMYVDDALTPVEVKQAEEHLRVCPECSELVARMREDRARLRALPIVQVPGTFREDLLRKAAAWKKNRPSAIRYLLPRLSSLAAAIMIMLVASNLYVFPAVWPGQPIADEVSEIGALAVPPEHVPEQNLGDGLRAQTRSVQFSGQDDAAGTEELATKDSDSKELMIMAASIPEVEQRSDANYWVSSGAAAAGLFGLGAGFFIYRYRHQI